MKLSEALKAYGEAKKTITDLTTGGHLELDEKIPYELLALGYCDELLGKGWLRQHYRQCPTEAAYEKMTFEQSQIAKLEARVKELEDLSKPKVTTLIPKDYSNDLITGQAKISDSIKRKAE